MLQNKLRMNEKSGMDNRRPGRFISVFSTQKPLMRPANPTFEPPTDVYETEKDVIVRLEIAGVKPQQVELVLSEQGRVLSISGLRADPAAGQRRKYYHMEIECGAFARRVRLPVAVNEDTAVAQYNDGFLVITLSKAIPSPEEPRSVPIE